MGKQFEINSSMTDIEEKELRLKELVMNMLNGRDFPDSDHLTLLFHEIKQKVEHKNQIK